jgi:hypothetical protein
MVTLSVIPLRAFGITVYLRDQINRDATPTDNAVDQPQTQQNHWDIIIKITYNH